MTGDDDRRKNIRVDFHVSADVMGPGGKGTEIHCDKTRDISLKGVYLITDTPLPQGCDCEVRLLLSGVSSELSINVQGRVARVDAGGMAVSFTDIEIDSLIHLKKVLYYNSGDPDRIDHELAGTTL